ncbi:unnamed protein product [Ectocarpus sp. 12 AP-2014]
MSAPGLTTLHSAPLPLVTASPLAEDTRGVLSNLPLMPAYQHRVRHLRYAAGTVPTLQPLVLWRIARVVWPLFRSHPPSLHGHYTFVATRHRQGSSCSAHIVDV